MKYKIILIGLSLLAPVITFAHSAPESVIIHMKNSGFEPQDVTIEQGQTVILKVRMRMTTGQPVMLTHRTWFILNSTPKRYCTRRKLGISF